MQTSSRPFLLAHAAGRDSGEVLRSCLAQLGTISPNHTLGFLYVTEPMAESLPAIVETLRLSTPGVHWVGSVGSGIIASGREYYDGPSMALMIADIAHSDFRLLTNVTAPEELIPRDDCADGCFAIVHGDPANPETPAILNALAENVPEAFFNGGLTSSATGAYQVLDGVCSGGISGVVIGGGTTVFTDHTQGCTPIGRKHAITEAEENILATLDGRPAYDVMKQEIGEVLARDLKRIGGYIFAGLPIKNSDTGDYLIRNLLGIDVKHGYIAVGEYLEGNEHLIFCRRDGNTAREDMARMLARLKQRVGRKTVRGGIYVSCLGRGRNQFGGNSEEVGFIREVLGDFPLVGFFANGEIYNGRLYGFSGVLTLFL